MTENPMINNTIKSNTNTPSDSITKICQLPMYINEKNKTKQKTKKSNNKQQTTNNKQQTTNPTNNKPNNTNQQ